jgi:hypothetical protein
VEAADRVEAAKEHQQQVATGGTDEERVAAAWGVAEALGDFEYIDAAIVFLAHDGLRRLARANPAALAMLLDDLPQFRVLRAEHEDLMVAIGERDELIRELQEAVVDYGGLIRELQEAVAELKAGQREEAFSG